ncbi:MAG: hypothetical protein RR575_15660, partial [Acinetobacter sp.]
KNCPMFSLCSNSIELRFRSVLRGNFFSHTGFNFYTEKSTSKSNNKNEFALLIKLFTRDARSRIK